MINMSYVRFENTFFALQECVNDLMENGLDSLSESERGYAEKLIEMCDDVSAEFEEELDDNF